MESSISDILSNYCDQLIGITTEDKSKKGKKKKNNSKSNLPENDVNEEIKSEICNLEENKKEKKNLKADKNHNIDNNFSKRKNDEKNKKSKVKGNIKKEIHVVNEKVVTNDGFKVVTDIPSDDSNISDAFDSDLEEFENDSLPKDIGKSQGKSKKITEDGFKVRYEDEIPPDDSDISDAFTDDEYGENFEDNESQAENPQRSRITEDGFKIRYDDQLPPDDSDISDAFSEDEDFQDMDKEMPNLKSNIHSIDRSRKVNKLLQGMIDDFGIDENALKDNKNINEKKIYVPQGSTKKINASKLTLAAKQKSSSEVTIIDYTEKRGGKKKEKPIVEKEMPLPSEDIESKKTEVSDERMFKKARFEVFKFGMGGFNKEKKQDARVALAVKLGAKPPKKKAINYKDLQVQKKNEKVQKQEDRENKRKMGLQVKKSATTKKRVRDTNRVGNFDTQVGRFDGGVVRLSKSDIYKIKRKK